MDNEESILLNRYRLKARLGNGAFGYVLLAEDLQLDRRPVAIKVSPDVLAKSPHAVEDVKREAVLAMMLSHPHIVTLRAFETDGETAFLVMDYVDGRSLQDKIDEKIRLDDLEVRRLGSGLAEALAYAHGSGVIHRDLKPANILLAHDDDSVKLTDFGISSLLHTRSAERIAVSGTLPFMSPQQLAGEPPCPMHDIYGLAATLYTCLAGRPPFYHGDVQQQIVSALPDPLDTPDRALAGLIMRGLTKSEHRRPPTMEAFAAALWREEAAPRPRVHPLAEASREEGSPFPADAESLQLS